VALADDRFGERFALDDDGREFPVCLRVGAGRYLAEQAGFSQLPVHFVGGERLALMLGFLVLLPEQAQGLRDGFIGKVMVLKSIRS
jgi:hypothetical protein